MAVIILLIFITPTILNLNGKTQDQEITYYKEQSIKKTVNPIDKKPTQQITQQTALLSFSLDRIGSLTPIIIVLLVLGLFAVFVFNLLSEALKFRRML